MATTFDDDDIRWGIYDGRTEKRVGIWEFDTEGDAQSWLDFQTTKLALDTNLYVSPIMWGEDDAGENE
jgi:hypothetical protein